VLLKHGRHAVATIQIGPISVHAIHGVELVGKTAGLVDSRVADAQWVLGETQADTTLDRVAQGVAVKIIQGLGRALDILKLDKAHGSVGLGSEAQATVSQAARKECAEFILRGVHGQVADIERVARRILIARVDWSTESRRSNSRGWHAGRRHCCSGGRVNGQALKPVVGHVIIVEHGVVKSALCMGGDRL